ncbi:hypothetical protein L3556_00355 [Candidatus Synechococcus calcipolaris G9]|uniref:DUF3598 domain-containing protein n=1 Tax=Candidatus Synechococcus calcipolaris G9 TaxID=1497997 RepID=A0ABT6EW91_9SYNE|nr:hypothetical protein [Candidatus Synechococcus calcipolaris]MDG2989388.1 hypothetical protein [Candidatus Synechococcus calcipolaris G9]
MVHLFAGIELFAPMQSQRLILQTFILPTVYRLLLMGAVAMGVSLPHRAIASLSPAIAEQILEKAASQFGADPDQLDILEAVPQIWSDGCLGLGGLRLDCAERLTPGWQVVVTNPAAFYAPRWVYRTNQSGSLILWDAAGSQMIATLIQPPARLRDEDLPPPLPERAIFRLVSYNHEGQNPQGTILYHDGQIIQTTWSSRGEPIERSLRQLSPSQVEQFQEFLRERRFARFDGYDFWPTDLDENPDQPDNIASYRMIFLSSPEVTVRFADRDEHRLAADISTILMTWNRLVERGRFP